MAQDSCPHAPAAAATSLATVVSYSAGVGTTTRVQRHDFVSSIQRLLGIPSMLPAAKRGLVARRQKNAVRGAEALQKVAGQPPLAPFAAMRRHR